MLDFSLIQSAISLSQGETTQFVVIKYSLYLQCIIEL